MRCSFLFTKSTIFLAALGLIALTLMVSGCSTFSTSSKSEAESVQFPITDQPSGETFPGHFIWHDLVTPDLQAAGEFYKKLFAWQIEYQNHYAIVRNNGQRIAGILQIKPLENTASGVWLPSVSVTDVVSASQRVKVNGGDIIHGPIDMIKRGKTVLIKDPLGTNLVLLSADGGDPLETEVATGDWLWDEIWTNNPATTAKFYASILGYDQVLSLKDDYSVFTHKGTWIAGIRQVASDSETLLWIPIVRVTDPYATAQLTEDLGGVVVISPDQAPNKGNIALISDPTGALLLIQRWPSQSPDGGS